MVKDSVFESLKTELSEIEGEMFNETLLKTKVDSAYNEVKMVRSYPNSYSELAIEEDMERYYSPIRGIALYDYNQTGAEGQTSYSADGTSIHYVERDKLFKGVIPLGGVL